MRSLQHRPNQPGKCMLDDKERKKDANIPAQACLMHPPLLKMYHVTREIATSAFYTRAYQDQQRVFLHTTSQDLQPPLVGYLQHRTRLLKI